MAYPSLLVSTTEQGCLQLSPYLVKFIRSGPRGYSPFCEQKLKRTQEKGNRYWPPSFLELQVRTHTRDMRKRSLLYFQFLFLSQGRQGRGTV